ncbi:MAG: hypothetical protein AAGA29_05860 [Planctomycetota bacterium]
MPKTPDAIARYAKLARRRHDYRRKLDQIELEMAAAEKAAIADLKDQPGHRASAQGMSLRVQQDAKVKAVTDTAGLVAALRRAKRPELIGVNWPALIAYAKHAAKGGLPKALEAVLDVRTTTRIDARRTPRK